MSGGGYWDDKEEGGPDGRAGTQTVTRTKKPSLYRVLLLNDDYTPMEFVVYVLERFFQKNQEDQNPSESLITDPQILRRSRSTIA